MLCLVAAGIFVAAWPQGPARRGGKAVRVWRPRASTTALCAKKKGGPKLISDDLLSSLAEEDDGQAAVVVAAPPAAAAVAAGSGASTLPPPLSKKEKKLAKLGLSDAFLSSIEEIDAGGAVATPQFDSVEDLGESGGKKDKKKDKKKKKQQQEGGADENDEDEEKEEVAAETEAFAEMTAQGVVPSAPIDSHADKTLDEEDEGEGESDLPAPVPISDDGTTLEQRLRKEKGSSRVRFAESSQPDYVQLAMEKISLVYGNEVVLKDASFSVETGERIGLVGPNGGGKTTSLKILAGDIESTTGEVVKSSRDLRIAFLRQEFQEELNVDNTLREELKTAFVVENRLLKDIAACEDEIALHTNDAAAMEEALNRLGSLQDKAISKGAYALESKVDKIMEATGFGEGDGDLPVKSFSGGWKMRIGIAKILLQDPNVLLLDEPTNHLDLDSVFWLEGFLVKQNIPMVIVSHDREFLDRVCNKIVDFEEGVTVTYKGNFSKFVDLKKKRLAEWREKWEKQLRFVKEEEQWIKKAKNDPNMSQQTRSKEIALEKFKNSDEWLLQPPKEKKFRFRFPPAPRCGESIVEASNLMHGYGEGQHKVLFKDVSFQVDRGNRIGFVGPNGSGKSTMLRLIMGTETPKSGFTEFGGNNVEANYFAQNQADAFDLDKSVLETVQLGAPSDISFTEIRNLLGQFMFKGDDVDKKLRVLSGGEKARVALCKMMLTPANLLLLDEPTNHLDITSKEVLEDALRHYDGSVMIVSHDRYFMSQVANTIFAFSDKTMKRHDCDYHDYMDMVGNLKEKVTSRYVEGDAYKITNAKEIVVAEQPKSKKNFGGSGVTSGNLNKVRCYPCRSLSLALTDR